MMSHKYDRSGVVYDSFIIKEITIEQCRSIFLEWYMGLPEECDLPEIVKCLLNDYKDVADANHPMYELMITATESSRG
jgi:hypothetical protein